jgi:hypothetical protein
MKKRNGIYKRLIAVSVVCVILAANCSQSPQTNVGFTAGRTSAAVAAVAGLISLVIGGLALRAAGRIGTGGGRAGAIVALVLGLISMNLGGLALARSRRSSSTD